MQTVEQPYQDYLDSHYQDLETIRTLGAWQIESASEENELLLVIVNHEEKVVVKCRYRSFFDRSDDIELLLRLPPDEGSAAGVLSWLRPSPPFLSAGNARPFPPDTEAQSPAT
jgi:hypothetical protein